MKCVICNHADVDRQTCDRCIAWVRRTLIRVEQLYTLLPYELAGRAGAATPPDPSGIHGDTEPMPGGDILVMLGPGSTGWHDTPDTDSILGPLERWNTAWRITLHQPAATTWPTVTRCVTGLTRMLTVAAQVEACCIAEFADDLDQMRQRLELALRVSPQRSPVPCITCGHRRLERPAPREDGRAFEWQCGRCHRNYTQADYWMAVRQNGQAV